METNNYLGIYMSRDTATVVCLGLHGRTHSVLGCFSVSVEQQEQADRPSSTSSALAALIAKDCTKRKMEFSEVAVALDCAMFMQHNVYSGFDDPKQIAQTIRFDTEQALAKDISDIAIAFKITSSDQAGSKLSVFTAQRKVLSEVLLALQSNNIDPVTIEPDVNCLSRFISQNASTPESQRGGTFSCSLSRCRGYFIVHALSSSQKISAVRTFLLSPAQDRGELLAREVPLTTALVEADEPINCVEVFDSTGSVNCQQLSEKLSIEVRAVNRLQSVSLGPDALADCSDPVEFVIAYGAALAHLEKTQTINFRNDFNPYQGKKIRLQKTLKFLSASVLVLVIAVGLYFQLQLLQRNKENGKLRKKFAKQYSAVMFGKKPPAKSNPVKKLASELRRIRDVKSGQLSITGEESVSAKLTLVLEAFNKCTAQMDLKIDSISVSTKTITIAGDTSSRRSTLKLFQAIKNNLQITQQRLEAKGGRDNFRITVVPKK